MTLEQRDIDEIIKHRIEQSLRTLEEADILIQNKSLGGAVNRIYYSVFYIISALGVKQKVNSSKHKQLLSWFNKTYVHSGKVDSEYGRYFYTLFQKRLEGDYEMFVEFTSEDVIKFAEKARMFIEIVKKIIKEDK